MRKLLNLSLFLIAISLLVSCDNSNEPVIQTDIDKIEASLKKVVDENGFTKCTILAYESDLSLKEVYSDVNFTISNGFLEISGFDLNDEKYVVRYNLLSLSNYTISAGKLYLNFNVSGANLTDLDQIENELKRVVEENNIDKCTIFTYNPDFTQKVILSYSDFIISNGNVIISGYNLNNEKYEIRYNLLYLSDYSVRGGQIYFNFTNAFY